MEHLEKILIGIVLFAVTSVLAYLFRMRQLYVATPKLYRHAPISESGSLCELIVFNKGNQAEEDIQVELDPDLKIELLASSSSDIKIDGAVIKIDRLHKLCDASAILMVERGVLDATKILSLSSKATKGSVCKRIIDVPANYAISFLFISFTIGIFPAMFYGFKYYDSLRGWYVEHQLNEVYNGGWTNLAKYYSSDIRESYSDQEFPISYAGRQVDENKNPMIQFNLYNKTALPMKVYINREGERAGDTTYFASAVVNPMSSTKILTREPEKATGSPNPKLEFSIMAGGEFVHGILYEPRPE